MSFGRFFAIFRARWWVGASLVVLAVAGTLVVCLFLPSRYTASASILLDSKPDPLTTMVYGGISPALMATQIDVIQSERVAIKVVRNLKLADNPSVREQWQQDTKGTGTVESWLADALRKGIEAAPSSLGSNIVVLSYKAAEPRFAATLVNAFVQAYIDTSLELRVDPARQYSTFFDLKSKDAREALEKAQARLTAFQRDKRIVSTDERFDVEMTRMNELSSQLVAIQAIATESGSRQVQAAGAEADRMQEVLGNAVISGIKADLVRSDARLQELNARLGASHPQVVEAKASIAELRSKLDAETARVTSGVRISNTINRQRESELRASLEAQRATVLRLKALRDEGALLQRDVDSAQRGYDAVLARLTTTNLESQSTQSNVYALSQASPPTKRSSPQIFLSTMAAAAISALLGIVAILGLELIDRRVRVGEDITETLGLPVIGVMPRPLQARIFSSRKESKMQERLMRSAVPALGKGA